MTAASWTEVSDLRARLLQERENHLRTRELFEEREAERQEFERYLLEIAILFGNPNFSQLAGKVRALTERKCGHVEALESMADMPHAGGCDWEPCDCFVGIARAALSGEVSE